MPTKYRRPVKRSPKSDPQQNQVYRLETEALGARTYQRMPWNQIRRMVSGVCYTYGVPMPRLLRKDLGRWAAEWSVDEKGVSRITFNTKKKTSRDTITVTHELAHHIHCWLGGKASEAHEAHGPEFMACHISVLDTCRMIPVVGMRAICAAYKIRFIDPGTRGSLTLLRKITRGSHSPAA